MEPSKEKRSIIEIDEDLCNGCGECIPGCAEGALRIIEGKARLISDLFCDGLGACIGHCPMGAMTIIEREAEPYDERKVMESMLEKGPATIEAHLTHLREHGALDYYREGVDFLRERGLRVPTERDAERGEGARAGSECAGGACPGSLPIALGRPSAQASRASEETAPPAPLANWPVQIYLVPVNAPYFRGADLLIAADCTAFASAHFQEKLARGRVVLIGCPKLDDAGGYAEKIARIIAENGPRSVTVAHMTVPCCFGMVALVRAAIAQSEKQPLLNEVVIGLDGSLEWTREGRASAEDRAAD